MTRFLAALLLTSGFAGLTCADEPKQTKPVRFMLHGNMSHELPTEEFLQFVERIKPDILVMGVFDQRLYSTAYPPTDRKPAKEPLSPDELLAGWKKVIERLHKSDIRLIGQMELVTVTDRPADREDRAGWFGYYEKGWDEKRLGQRPAKTAAEMLEEFEPGKGLRESDTTAKCGCRVNNKALRGCINKPGWAETQKRLVKAAIDIGVDGFITNRNAFGHCSCSECTAKFRKWLSNRYTAAELKSNFGIADLAKYDLTCVMGSHQDPETVPTSLVLEKLRFSKQRIKEYFDEVFIEYGRSQKKDLLLGQWNHLGTFDELHLDRGHLPVVTRTSFAHGAADERWGLTPEQWGRGEDLIWYCNWGTTQNTILEKEFVGDTVLYGKYVRALAAGKPYTVNKYDFYRPRNMMAEAAALGYVTNAIATPYQTEEDREVVIRYFDFLKKHGKLFEKTESLAEVGLVFPRRALHAGDASALEYVEAAGRAMIRDHVLFDILPDDLLSTTSLNGYRAVILAAPEFLEDGERKVLSRYVTGGGKLILTPVAPADRKRAGVIGESTLRQIEGAEPWKVDAVTVRNVRTERDALLTALRKAIGGAEKLSRFEAPWTVEVHAYSQPEAKRVVVHLVNYNHKEKATGKSVVAREAPIVAEPVKVRLHVPKSMKARSVRFYSPDDKDEHALRFEQKEGVVEFHTPGFLVYGLCVLEE